MSDAISGIVDDVERGTNGVVDDATNAVDNDAGSASTTSPAAQVTRLYDTALDRGPDEAGLTFWTNAVRAGTGLDAVADLFIRSPEFQDRYGDLDSGAFVAQLYRNVLNREGDADGLGFWTDALASGRADRSDVVVAFSESAEHVAVVGPVATGDNPLI